MTGDACNWPLLLRLSRGLVAEQPDLALQLAESIRTKVPFYQTGSRVPAEAVDQSAREHISALIDNAALPDGPETAPRALGERRARDGVELADVLDALRVGLAFLWSRIVDFARRTGAASDAELVDLAFEVGMMHETYVRTMTAGYRHEYSRVLLGRQQERLGLVYGLLTARGSDAVSPWEAVDRLGLSRTEGFVIIAAATPAARRTALPRAEQSLADAGITSAWVMVANVGLGIVSVANPSWQSTLKKEATAWGATAGVSPVMSDYARIGFAVRLARIALATAATGEVVAFDEAPVAMVAASSPEVTERIVDSVLGGLSALPPTHRGTLFATLDAWFESDGSISTMAARLDVHENTVRNRIHRISAITGLDLTRPRQAAELYLALAGQRSTSYSDHDNGGPQHDDRFSYDH